MGNIIIVATMDMDNGLYKENGKPLFKLPKDVKHFKEVIKGKNVVFDKDTYKKLDFNIPSKKTYVYNFGEDYKNKQVTTFESVVDIFELAKEEDVYIFGGEELYQMMIDFTDKMILTHVHSINRNASQFFPDYDYKDWKYVNKVKVESDKKNKQSFTFATYERR